MAKALILTAHVRIRLRERRLKIDWIEAAARHPVWREQDPRDPSVERRFRIIDEFGGRVLRVACVETETSIRIISAMFDRNARRKP